MRYGIKEDQKIKNKTKQNQELIFNKYYFSKQQFEEKTEFSAYWQLQYFTRYSEKNKKKFKMLKCLKNVTNVTNVKKMLQMC